MLRFTRMWKIYFLYSALLRRVYSYRFLPVPIIPSSLTVHFRLFQKGVALQELINVIINNYSLPSKLGNSLFTAELPATHYHKSFSRRIFATFAQLFSILPTCAASRRDSVLASLLCRYRVAKFSFSFIFLRADSAKMILSV
jgi:hypothetical protein